MDKDEHDKAADDFFSAAPKYRTKKNLARAIRAAHANGMFVANAVYQNAGLSSSHVGMIEVAQRAHALRRKNG